MSEEKAITAMVAVVKLSDGSVRQVYLNDQQTKTLMYLCEELCGGTIRVLPEALSLDIQRPEPADK
jgi:hypothetical protein